MRDELHLMELVDRYLDGSMNAEERTAFEARAHTNSELRQLVEDQRALREGVARVPVRAAAGKAYRAYRFGKPGPWAAGAVVLAIVAATSMLLWRAQDHSGASENTANLNEQYARVLDDTTGTHLDPLVLTIDPNADTTLLTPNGIVLDIPRGAFLDSLGNAITTPVRVTLFEALEPLDIMKAGLSTMSGDTLLETGGMFYFDAQVNGKKVRIDPAKPITAMVPAQPGQGDMQLYQGVNQTDGMIDWRNPRPLKKSLVPVDITTLNFYPPHFEAKLADLGQDVMNKAFKDSLYYSFVSNPVRSNASTPWPYEERDFESGDSIWSPFSMGQKLFFESCASCHSPTRVLTGPALKGAKARWGGKRSIHDFVRNPQEVIASGDEYAKNLIRRWNASVMTPVDLTDKEIDAIFLFADAAMEDNEGIQPAKIKTIWNVRFNGTNLATRAFEERMRAIHGTCDDAVLDLYVNNLDKDLSEIDARVGRMGHPMFDHFAERNDGRVDLPEHAADRLRRVYEHWSRAEAEAIRKTQEKFWNEQYRLDQKGNQRRTDHADEEQRRNAQNFQKEYAANMAEACRQLGIKKLGPRREPPITAYVANITNPGWWNVDRAVFQTTADRKSMNFTDKNTGKTATLTYTPFTVEVAERANYDELVVYLIPNQLNSYQRMKEGEGGFSEKLNSIFNYDLFCLGLKDKQQFAFTTNVSGRSDITATLAPTDENGLRAMLRTKGNVEERLLDEDRFLSWSATDNSRRRANIARQELRSALLSEVFPCASDTAAADTTVTGSAQ